MQLARRISRLSTESAFAMVPVVAKMRAEGKDVISFGIGEPAFDTPQNIKDACIKAINDNQTHYASSSGLLALKQALAKEGGKFRGMDIEPDEVVVTPGSKPIIFGSMHAILDEGDEVIYPNPGYPTYESVANFIGAKPIALPLWEKKNFSFDVEMLKKMVNKKTKMIILNSPQNPTGSMLSDKDLEEIAALAKKFNFWVMTDEIYSKIVYEGKFTSIASLPGMKERTVISDGFSKAYAMTGWRLGYGIMPKELAKHITTLEINANSCTNTFVQIAGVEAINGDQFEVEGFVEEFKKRRDLTVKLLNQIKGFKCQVPKGAFYVFPNVSEACKNLGFKDSLQLQAYILEKANVLVLARTYFGPKNAGENEEYVRLSYVTTPELIEKGLERVKKLVEGK